MFLPYSTRTLCVDGRHTFYVLTTFIILSIIIQYNNKYLIHLIFIHLHNMNLQYTSQHVIITMDWNVKLMISTFHSSNFKQLLYDQSHNRFVIPTTHSQRYYLFSIIFLSLYYFFSLFALSFTVQHTRCL